MRGFLCLWTLAAALLAAADEAIDLQPQIDSAAAAGGGRVVVPAGRWTSGPLRLKSGVELHLAKGARLVASDNLADYPEWRDVRHIAHPEALPRGRNASFILADEAHDIAITGEGTIDCRGAAFVREKVGSDWTGWRCERTVPPEKSLPRAIFLAGCSNVVIRGVTLVDPPAGWSYWLHDCDNVLVENADVKANVEYPNNDGYHVNSCRNVVIRNCDLETGDDSVVVRANNRTLAENRVCENVVVSNCTLRSWSSAVRIGWTNDGLIRRCLFRDLKIRDSSVGVSFLLPRVRGTDYGREATRFEEIAFENIEMKGVVGRPVLGFVADASQGTRCAGFSRIAFRNVTASGLEKPLFRGTKECPIAGISFENCRFETVPESSFPNWRQHGAAAWDRFLGAENVFYEPAFEIDFLRHGETTWNRAVVLQGTLAYPPLSAKGVAMTRATADALAAAGVKYDRVFTSPLARTRETAAIIAAKTGPEPVVREILHERSFGSAQGRRIAAGETMASVLAAATGVETEAEVAARARAFLEEMKGLDGRDVRILAVTHSHFLKGLVAALKGGAFDTSCHLPNDSITTVRFENGRFSLVAAGRVLYDAAFFDAIRQPRIVAHRGAGDLTMPEHSRAAYRDAVAKRCDIVKLDLHETKDGVIVLSHDDTLAREMGWSVNIGDVTYAEIMAKGTYLEKGGVRGEKIVRLDEALEIAKSVPEYWIDFKHYTPAFAEKVVAQFRASGVDLSRVMCATFTCKALTYLRTAHPEIRRIAHMGRRAQLKNFLEMKDYYDLWGINIGARCEVKTPTGMLAEQPLETIAELKRRGLWVSLHSIGYAPEHEKYKASGCDAYVSDDVSVLRPEIKYKGTTK